MKAICCLLPANYTIYNRFPSEFVTPQIGENYPPLYLDAIASDPDGTTPTITRSCTTGESVGNLSIDPNYPDFLRCDPVLSNTFPVSHIWKVKPKVEN